MQHTRLVSYTQVLSVLLSRLDSSARVPCLFRHAHATTYFYRQIHRRQPILQCKMAAVSLSLKRFSGHIEPFARLLCGVTPSPRPRNNSFDSLHQKKNHIEQRYCKQPSVGGSGLSHRIKIVKQSHHLVPAIGWVRARPGQCRKARRVAIYRNTLIFVVARSIHLLQRFLWNISIFHVHRFPYLGNTTTVLIAPDLWLPLPFGCCSTR